MTASDSPQSSPGPRWDDGPTWGCPVCRQETFDDRKESIRLVAKAKTTLLAIYQCEACGTWYEHNMSDRLFERTDEEARRSLQSIEEGL